MSGKRVAATAAGAAVGLGFAGWTLKGSGNFTPGALAYVTLTSAAGALVGWKAHALWRLTARGWVGQVLVAGVLGLIGGSLLYWVTRWTGVVLIADLDQAWQWSGLGGAAGVGIWVWLRLEAMTPAWGEGAPKRRDE